MTYPSSGWYRSRKLPKMTSCLGASLLLASTLSVADPAASNRLFTTPAGNALELTLTAPWTAIAQDRTKDPEATPATLKVGDSPLLDIKVKPRGKSRRRQTFCRFPPLWLDFPKKKLANTAFAGQNKLKLVTHCARLGSNSQSANDRLWSEYLAYRLLNHITDQSFRVRATQIHYVDNQGDTKGRHPGFLIEHKSSVAERLQLTTLRQDKVARSSLEPKNAALVALFELFIGGVDFSQLRGPEGDNCCHNLTPMADPQGRVVGLAYDFDATGFVDPPYGAPLPQLKLKGYTQRRYRGFCSYKAQHASALRTFLEARPGLEAIIDGFPEISEGRRKKLKRFINGFYKKLPDETKGVAWLDKHCR